MKHSVHFDAKPSTDARRLPCASEAFHRAHACPICSQQYVQRVASRDRRGNPLSTVMCTTCGLVSHERLPSEPELEAYYRSEYRQTYHGSALPLPHRIVRAWRTAKSLVRRLRPHLKPGDQVLEVGAGLGCTVKALELAGYNAVGIEPGLHDHDFALHTLKARVVPKRLTDLVRRPVYDFILLVHVIEHLREPVASLRQLGELLRPGGRLYVECPNLAAPHAAPSKLFHDAHLFNFTPETLTAAAGAAGLRVLQSVSSPRDTNIMLLLEVDPRPNESIPQTGCESTLRAMRRFNAFTYHARPSYLLSRIGKLLRVLSDRVLPGTRVDRIIRQAQANGAKSAFKRIVRSPPTAYRRKAA